MKIKEKKVLVFGSGISGEAACSLLLREGAEVVLYDGNDKLDREEILSKIPESGNGSLQILLGTLADEKKAQLLKTLDLVVMSPGVPTDLPIVNEMRDRGIPIWGEIELAYEAGKGEVLAITGTNGKTTTTSLLGQIMKNYTENTYVVGNIGNPYTSVALETTEDSVIVAEMSSFQLETIETFRPRVSAILNITPDHLDRYDHCMQNYIDAKFRITQNQTPDDAFIFWNDDPIIRHELAKHGLKAHLYPFAAVKEDGAIAYVEDHEVKITEPIAFNMEQEELALTGQHNLYNSLAAGISANLAGIAKENIRKALSDFRGVEHRLEKVARVRGIDFINDSKATNVNSCWYALQSMTTKTVLILGGKDKGNDYTEIEDLVREKCSALVYLGLHNEKLHDFFDRFGLPVADVQTGMKDAVEAAYKLAKKGETVLLSPCCASFDLFNSYEDRGDQFKKYVREL